MARRRDGPLLDCAAAAGSFRRGREQWGGERRSRSPRRVARHPKPRQLKLAGRFQPCDARNARSTCAAATTLVIQSAIANAIRLPSPDSIFCFAVLGSSRPPTLRVVPLDSQQPLRVGIHALTAATAASAATHCIVNSLARPAPPAAIAIARAARVLSTGDSRSRTYTRKIESQQLLRPDHRRQARAWP